MEHFVSGYCRVLDESRMVTVETENGEFFVDCAYFSCPYAAACPIGKQITALCNEEKI